MLTSRGYLSIDLDFFEVHKDRMIGYDMMNFFDNLFVQYNKVYLCREHHNMLEDINRIKPDVLVNLDWHSDIAGFNSDSSNMELHELDDGTWVDYVEGSKLLYVWIYPNSQCINGETNRDNSGYCNDKKENNPFLSGDSKTICRWKNVIKANFDSEDIEILARRFFMVITKSAFSESYKLVSNIDFSFWNGVGVSYSPMYISDETEKFFMEIYKRYSHRFILGSDISNCYLGTQFEMLNLDR